jgi:hypothetical protein
MPENNEATSAAPDADTSDEEPKLTPLQRVKQQQMLMQKNRNRGAQRPDSGGGARGGSGSSHQRAHLNRRSGP